jgi:hypothetical protein
VDPLEDPGQLQLQVHYDPSNPPKRTDPDDPEQIEVTYRKPKGAANAARLVGEGWLQEWGAEMNLGAKMTATLTVKFTGLLNVVKAPDHEQELRSNPRSKGLPRAVPRPERGRRRLDHP